MFVFLGSYSGGGGGSSDDDDSQDEGSTDDHAQTGVDDFTGDDEDDDSDSGAAAAGVAGAAGAAGAASGAGAGGAGAAGAAAGAGAGTVTEPSEGDNSGDGGDGEEGEECEEEEEEQEPEAPDIEEPETEPEDGSGEEDDVDEPETEEDLKEEDDIDDSDDVEEDTEEEDDDEEDEDDEDDDEDEEEDEEVVVVQEVDALSAMSWGVQPVMKRVEECYGEEIDLFYKPAPVREVDPEQEKQKWIDAGQQLGMPVDPSFWDDDPPESTELANRAFEAANSQRRGMDYIRAMWRRGVAAGRDINDRDVLVELASDLGLDQERFEEDLEEVELESGERGELPFTFMEIQGKPVPKNGRVRYSDFKTQFTFQGIDEQDPQELSGFVEEHGPVATVEVIEVYEIQERGEAVQRLEELDGVSSFEVGGERFWTVQ